MSRFCTRDDIIIWKHFPRYWPFVRGIHRSQVNSPHKSQWRGALMFSLICAWTNGWVNNRDAGDFRCHRAHYDVTVIRGALFPWYLDFLHQFYPRVTLQPLEVKLSEVRLSVDRISVPANVRMRLVSDFLCHNHCYQMSDDKNINHIMQQ